MPNGVNDRTDKIGAAMEEILAFGTEPPESDPAENRHRVAVARADPWKLSEDKRYGALGKMVHNRQTTFTI